MESLCGFFKSRWNSERIVIPSFKQAKIPPKITMKINDKNLTYARKFLGGQFNYEKHNDEMEKKLLYVQEREWKAPFKMEAQVSSSYLKIVRGAIIPSLEEVDELKKFDRTYEGEVLKGTKIPHGRGIMLVELDGDFFLHEGWFIGGLLWGRGRQTAYR